MNEYKIDPGLIFAMDEMKGAGLEPCLYWFIEAKDPENVTLPAQVTATLAPVTL